MAKVQNGEFTAYELRNFRRFEATGVIRLAPVTLLFGKNSSGKTSLLRAPLLLKQLVESRSEEIPLIGSDVDFGSYRELVFQGQLRRNVSLRFDFFGPGRRRFLPRGAMNRVHPAYRSLLEGFYLDVELHWNMRNSKTQIDRVEIGTPANEDAVIFLARRGPNEFSLEFPAMSERIIVSNPLNFPSLRFVDLLSIPLTTTEERANILSGLDYIVFVVMNRLADAVRSLIHIGPLRQMPDRAYRTEQGGQTGSAGTVVQILENQQTAQKRVSEALSHMGMAKEVALEKLAPGYVGILLTDPVSGRADNLADVGFGVSQVLPMLAILATAPAGSTVLIEQPELHLHPDAQGQLADVLFQLAEERSLTLVVETHSEHVLLRAQRRVAEGALRAEQVAPYFVDSGRVLLSDINERGRLDEQAIPAGFFEEEWSDVINLAKAVAKRRSS